MQVQDDLTNAKSITSASDIRESNLKYIPWVNATRMRRMRRVNEGDQGIS
jgi:hypothetical protein